MRLYRIDKDVDFPEKEDTDLGYNYINVRANERIDVRPGESRDISTGLRASFRDSATVYSEDIFTNTRREVKESGEELFIFISNGTHKTIMIHPGMVIGRVIMERDDVE